MQDAPFSFQKVVEAARRGDQDAFRQLYEKTYREKFYLAKRYMKSDTEAEDVLQDAYVKAWKRLDALVDPERFSAWFGMIVANTAKDALKAKQPMLFSELEEENEDGEAYRFEQTDTDESRQPELAFTNKEREELLRSLREALSAEQQMAVSMFYEQQLTVREIAEVMDCSENTVKSRLNYGRKNLKARVEELQKKGWAVLGLAVIPLYLSLTAEEARAEQVELPFMRGSGAAGSVSSASAGSASSAGAASATAGTAAKAGIFSSLAAKIAVIAAAAAVAAGVAAGVGISAMRRARTESEAASVEAAGSAESVEAAFSKEVPLALAESAQEPISMEEASDPEPKQDAELEQDAELDEPTNWKAELRRAVEDYSPAETNNDHTVMRDLRITGYALCRIDEDEIPEILIFEEGTEENTAGTSGEPVPGFVKEIVALRYDREDGEVHRNRVSLQGVSKEYVFKEFQTAYVPGKCIVVRIYSFGLKDNPDAGPAKRHFSVDKYDRGFRRPEDNIAYYIQWDSLFYSKEISVPEIQPISEEEFREKTYADERVLIEPVALEELLEEMETFPAPG